MKCYEVPKYSTIVCISSEEDIYKVRIGNELLSDLIAEKEAYEVEAQPV